MWMMGYNDGGDFFAGRNKLRTIVPRPATHAALNPPCLGRSDHHLFSFNHHLAGMTDQQSKREFNTQQQVVVSSRWNPTPEQLQTLEELYGRGTRTPSAEQIQHITAQLRRYGKIEGKNVFYWFQNHKARERQKRRRQLDSTSDEPQQQPHNVENIDKKESGANNGTSLEVEGTKNYASHTNSCTTTLAGKTTDSMQRIVAKAAINPECRSADGWLQFEDSSELHQRKSPIDDDHHHKTATWHTMKFFGSSSPSPTIIHSSPSNSTLIRRSKQMKPQNLNIFFRQPNYEEEEEEEDRSNCESQTLQLFPLQSSSQENDQENGDEKEAEIIMNTTTTMTPQKFFEFLPLKN